MLDQENGFYDSMKNELNLEIRFHILETVENKIILEIDNFSSWFCQTGDENAIHTPKMTLGNCEWFIEAISTRCTEENEYYLGFYLYCKTLNKEK